jgi:hypothetical protein
MSKLTDFVRVGRWLLCGLVRRALQCKRRFTAAHKKAPTSAAVPSREHLLDRGESQLVLLSTQPVILRPSYSEFVTPVRDLPRESTTAELENAIRKLELVKLGSPKVFPVDLYLSHLQSTHGLSECVQSGTSSIRLALELSGQTAGDEATNNFVVHFSRRPQPHEPITCDSTCSSDARE